MAATRRMPAGRGTGSGNGNGERGSDPVEAALDDLEVRFLLDPETTFERDEDVEHDRYEPAE